jgi:SAM-dependent methyltransferase
MTTYDSSFYKYITGGSASSAERVVPYLVELLKPRSVVDVGCGTGAWTAEFKRQGVEVALGVDGAYIDKSQLRIPPDTFIDRDLEQPLNLDQKFDLAISMEVAEHLSPGRAASFVKDLAHLAPFVVFSAAVPLQGGTNHINEQWAMYWKELFKGQGFQAVDCLRERFWNDPAVEWWYRQNTFLYVAKDRAEQFAHYAGTMPLNVIHPDLFLAKVDPAPLSLGFLVRSLPGAAKRYFSSRIRGSNQKDGH